jgi:hypothetical protein
LAFESWSVHAFPLAHLTGRAAIPAVALFLAGIGAALGASQLRGPPSTRTRLAASFALGVLAAGCFLFATILPILLH